MARGRLWRLAWKSGRQGAGMVVAVGVLVSLFLHVSWHDYAVLPDGRRGRILAVSGSPEAFTVQTGDTSRAMLRGDMLALQPGMGGLLRRADGHLLLGACFLALLVPLWHTMRLQWLCDGLQVSSRRARITAVCLLGYVVGATALGTLGGEVYRAMALRQEVGSWERIIISLLVDRLVGLIALVTCAALSAVWYLPHAVFGPLAHWLVGAWLGGVALGLCGVWVSRYRDLPSWGQALLPEKLQAGWRLLCNASAALYTSGVLSKVLWVSLALQATHLLALVLMGHAFGFAQAYEAALLVMPLATVLAVLIPTPQGLGVLEGTLVAFLATSVHGSVNMCVLFALGVRLLRLVWVLPGFLLLGGRYWAARSSTQAS